MGVHDRERAMHPGAQVSVLGPPAVSWDNRVVPVGGRRTSVLLAALVLSVNHVVPVSRLVDVVWSEGPPGDPMNALQAHVSRLRHLLGTEAIEAVDHGYLLSATCDQVDACAFERSVERASECLDGEPATARSLVRSALGMWRGPAFGEIGDEEPFRLEALRLDELRRTAVELELEAEVALGERVRVVAQLRSAVAADPYRERLWHLLVEALLADERRVEALEAWNGHASVLAELGLPPSAAMVDLRDRIVGPGACAV